jgi:heme-degrading monooxygenase HmoA
MTRTGMAMARRTAAAVALGAAMSAFSGGGSVARAETVVLINVFEVQPGTEEEAIRWWEAARDFLARQPGYVSTRLHRALRPDARFQLVNVAEWTSAEAFQAATARMQRELAAAPPAGLRFTPGLYRVIRE